ncbi:MAG TPA: phosphoadenylyl-sulfate reductase [Rhodopila sp.]|nr:phosphoadenylyl-sulfate reductase [Rhodopila sp.]
MFRDTTAAVDRDSYHPQAETIAQTLNSEFPQLDVGERLHLVSQAVRGRLVHTTSFGLEGQVLTHLLVEAGVDVDFVTLDTGRLFAETYEVWAATEARYGIKIRAFHPDGPAIEALIAARGINGFRGSVDARKACCAVRKLDPLRRALSGAAAWFTGLRADQSAHRASMRFVSYESQRDLVKINPLLDWTRDQVAALVANRGIPHSTLHAQGFLSIGCAPCTRAVSAGEPERAGRWWWEGAGNQECGLHVAEDGRLVRSRSASPPHDIG